MFWITPEEYGITKFGYKLKPLPKSNFNLNQPIPDEYFIRDNLDLSTKLIEEKLSFWLWKTITQKDLTIYPLKGYPILRDSWITFHCYTDAFSNLFQIAKGEGIEREVDKIYQKFLDLAKRLWQVYQAHFKIYYNKDTYVHVLISEDVSIEYPVEDLMVVLFPKEWKMHISRIRLLMTPDLNPYTNRDTLEMLIIYSRGKMKLWAESNIIDLLGITEEELKRIAYED